jgi:hypothetical protein
LLAAIGWLLAATSAFALNPAEIFDRAGPSVWAVRALDASEKPLATGSGVVVAPGKLVTSCRLLAKTSRIELRRANAVYEAKLELPDVERDLCQLDAPGLPAPAAAGGSAQSLRPGQRIYVVGYTRGIEQSITEGLVSALRDAAAGAPLIQTSVPAARGLYGAGAFDENGRLVGIVTSSATDAPGVTLAVPAEWLGEMQARGQAALAKRPAAGTPGLPAPGATYHYQWADLQYSRQEALVVRVKAVDGGIVSEVYGTDGADMKHATVDVNAMVFLERRLANGVGILEFAPYLLARSGTDIAIPAGGAYFPSPGDAIWSISVTNTAWEEASVSSGNFRAFRVDIAGSRDPLSNVYITNIPLVQRFQYTAWYAPDTRRCVKILYQAWNSKGSQIADESIELIEYRAN